MNDPKTELTERLMALGLSAMFKVKRYVGPTEFVKLIDLAGSRDELKFRDAVLEIVQLATEIQAGEADAEEEMILFDEALERAAKETLSEVQMRGLSEALEMTDAPLTPELIATYLLSKETVMRPARFEIEMASQDDESLDAVRRTALAVLVPESFDVVAKEDETIVALLLRTCVALELIQKTLDYCKTVGSWSRLL